MPRIKNDFTQVKNFGDLVDWAQASTGVALPYILGIIGSKVAGMVALASTPLTGPLGAVFGTALSWQAPMAWIYAGETYGNMRGNMDQRDAGMAFISGIIMPTLEPILKRAGGKNMTVTVGPFTFHLEALFKAILKFIGISIFIFIFIQFGFALKKPVTWVKITSVADGIEL